MNLIKFVLFIGLLLGITEKGLTQEHDWKKDNLKGIVVSVKEIEYETETKFGEHIKKGIKNTNQIFYNERGIIRKKINEYTHDTYSTYYIYNEAQKLIKEITVKLDSIETMNTCHGRSSSGRAGGAAAGGQDASSANNSRSLDKVTTRNHFHSFVLLHSHITALQVFCMI